VTGLNWSHKTAMTYRVCSRSFSAASGAPTGSGTSCGLRAQRPARILPTCKKDLNTSPFHNTLTVELPNIFVADPTTRTVRLLLASIQITVRLHRRKHQGANQIISRQIKARPRVRSREAVSFDDSHRSRSIRGPAIFLTERAGRGAWRQCPPARASRRAGTWCRRRRL
jgi:hypothetical protein